MVRKVLKEVMYSCCIETQFLSGSSGCGTEGEKWNMQDIKVVLAVMVVSIFIRDKTQLLSKY